MTQVSIDLSACATCTYAKIAQCRPNDIWMDGIFVDVLFQPFILLNGELRCFARILFLMRAIR